MKKLIFLLSLIVIGSQQVSAGVVSFDQLAVSDDLTVSKYNADLNTIYQEFNSSIESANIADNTVAEADMADDANPRIRTDESASCPDLVVSGLLSSTTSGTLTGSVPSGTVYPDGFRVVKSSSTNNTFTASKWTYVDIDINGDFTFTEVSINGDAPAVAPNSARLSRVSTDSTEVTEVTDLRTTNCAAGPLSAIADVSGEASLDDMFSKGSPIKSGSNTGWIQGIHVSYDTHTTFLVTGGSAYINGKYRAVENDITVTTSTDDPDSGQSGIDTGAPSASTRYNVFAVADEDTTDSFSVTYSSSASPAGVTNFKKIGEIVTDGDSLFTSRDIVRTHSWQQREIVGAYAVFSGTGALEISNSLNVSSVAKNATGDYAITIDKNFTSADYVIAGAVGKDTDAASDLTLSYNTNDRAVGSLDFFSRNIPDGVLENAQELSIQLTGDIEK